MTNSQSIKCLLIVALPAEAKPLIGRYKLSTLNHTPENNPENTLKNSPFRCWKNNDIALVETGIGKLNSAAATSYALAITGASCCINVGIAGSDNDIGSAFVAHRVVDQGTGKIWYPQQMWQHTMDSLSVETVDSPTSQYQSDAAFDMEMSGVMSAASRFLSTEMIQSIKVISDNTTSDYSEINKELVINLISDQLSVIESAVCSLIRLNDDTRDSGQPDSMLKAISAGHYAGSGHSGSGKSFHLTESQKITLKRILQRHLALFGTLPDKSVFSKSRDSRELIHQLRSLVDSVKTHY